MNCQWKGHMNWNNTFEAGLSYEDFLERHAKPEQRARWQHVYDKVHLTDSQTQLLALFTRRMNVICLAGAWCGDCVQQCPIFPRFAQASPQIQLRFLDRDAHMEIQHELAINGGHRVPVLVFLSEDYLECGRYGERTLSRYRDLARSQLGPACPTGIVALDATLLAAMIAEWLGEFERVQWMLRLSPRLRQKHGD